ncbi:nucleotide-diphospho-sugar transferase [Chaetomium fimeti]|uniref:Nucleotide-diphospho-sugar transferase n=1 Tax=Chaetomium fimeti TaxID=1854472 RepID=A0AAE0LRM3_9PEZI|nr:nucleotide-diphospho-sugar transferase [Chaetomium fimeti]
MLPHAYHRYFLWIAIAATFCLLASQLTSVHRRQPKQNPASAAETAESLVETTALRPPPASEIPIPRQIWQIFFAPPGIKTLDKGGTYASDWISMAPGYGYTLMGDEDATAFVDSSFASSRPDITATFHSLRNPAQKSDLLRYLLLWHRGGIYSDMDTRPLVPVEEWLPPAKRREVGLVVALEWDVARDGYWDENTRDVQFCQWTIAAAPGHPVLGGMVNHTIAALHDVARQQGKALDEADFSDLQVLNSTGPMAWSDVVFDEIRRRDPLVEELNDLMDLRSPKYAGDLVVLPVESFRAESSDEWGLNGWRKNRRALVRHYYKGAWKAQG